MTAIFNGTFLELLKQFAEARVQRGPSQSRLHLIGLWRSLVNLLRC